MGPKFIKIIIFLKKRNATATQVTLKLSLWLFILSRVCSHPRVLFNQNHLCAVKNHRLSNSPSTSIFGFLNIMSL